MGKKTEITKREPVPVVVAKIGMKQAIFVTILTIIGSIVGFYLGNNKKEALPQSVNPVPPIPSILVKNLPGCADSIDCKTIKDIAIFDLRNWKYTPDSLKGKRNSPIQFMEYLHIEKLNNVKKIIPHYATYGKIIDLRCITHTATLYKKDTSVFHDGQNMEEYALDIDVQNNPIKKEFLIVVEGTYWNCFNDLHTNKAYTYVDNEVEGLDELDLMIFFPFDKPFKSYDLLSESLENGKLVEDTYRGESSFYTDKDKRFIYWSIKERKANHHYCIRWDW